MVWSLLVASASALPPGADWGVTGQQERAYMGLCTGVLDANGDGYDDLFASAHGWSAPADLEGSVTVFYGSSVGLPATPDWRMEGGQAYATAGSCAANAGDVNGDGYEDLLVGLSGYDHPQSDEGAAVLYLGGPNGLAASPSWAVESDVQYAELGRGLAGVGDVDEDGYDDVLIGAPWLDGARPGSGRVQLHRGGPNGLAQAPAWVDEADDTYSSFGFAVGGGDVNGDGYVDLLVGAYSYGRHDGGAAFVYLGGPAGPSLTPDWRVVDPQGNAEFGASLVALDVNADGYDDVAVGADRHENGERREGVAVLFLGSPNGPSTTPDWTAESNQASAEFGWSLAGGDIDGDGFDDLAVGSPQSSFGEAAEGAVSVYLGSAAGLAAAPVVRLESNQADAGFGSSVVLGADTDGDGVGELVVGANTWDGALTSEGAVFLYEP
ncbi:MAG: FG-GAP repeat protein [Myxococcales bacterium]|nr:FG-GAP repeat protein [Myxococcales bacterium]